MDMQMQKSALARWKEKVRGGEVSYQARRRLLKEYGLPLDRWTEGIRRGNEALLRRHEIPKRDYSLWPKSLR